MRNRGWKIGKMNDIKLQIPLSSVVACPLIGNPGVKNQPPICVPDPQDSAMPGRLYRARKHANKRANDCNLTACKRAMGHSFGSSWGDIRR